MNRVKIVSHRGVFGGNIVENTLEAFRHALSLGADVLETDVHRTKDGRVVLYHDDVVHRLLPLQGRVEDFTFDELREPELLNVIGGGSGLHIASLEEFLDLAKGRCLIDLDKSWNAYEESYALVEERDMLDQVWFKSFAPFDDVTAFLERHDFKPLFVPCLTKESDIALLEKMPKQVRMPCIEPLFTDENDAIASVEWLNSYRERGIEIFVTALTLGGVPWCRMTGGHDDSRSVMGDPDGGWGWLLDRGITVIQTDWVIELDRYLRSRGVR